MTAADQSELAQLDREAWVQVMALCERATKDGRAKIRQIAAERLDAHGVWDEVVLPELD